MKEPSFVIVEDPATMDLDRIYRWIAFETYWGEGMTRERFDRALRGSMAFAAVAGGETAGFARVVTDRATFAYLTDVFVPPAWRGQGVANALMRAILAHRDLQGLRRMTLVTRTAQALYEPFGFGAVSPSDGFMQRLESRLRGL